ncbi:MAG: DUF302 domain-containing protein [bacterium]
MSNYGIKKKVDLSFQETVNKVKDELKNEEFGVLAEIDMRKTFKEKLDKENNNYRILEACNPSFAFEAMAEDPELGLLLPCNLIVYETDDQEVKMAAIDPEKVLGMSENKKVNEIAEEIKSRLKRVIKKI